jgi:hypothetical protein
VEGVDGCKPLLVHGLAAERTGLLLEFWHAALLSTASKASLLVESQAAGVQERRSSTEGATPDLSAGSGLSVLQLSTA